MKSNSRNRAYLHIFVDIIRMAAERPENSGLSPSITFTIMSKWIKAGLATKDIRVAYEAVAKSMYKMNDYFSVRSSKKPCVYLAHSYYTNTEWEIDLAHLIRLSVIPSLIQSNLQYLIDESRLHGESIVIDEDELLSILIDEPVIPKGGIEVVEQPTKTPISPMEHPPEIPAATFTDTRVDVSQPTPAPERRKLTRPSSPDETYEQYVERCMRKKVKPLEADRWHAICKGDSFQSAAFRQHLSHTLVNVVAMKSK